MKLSDTFENRIVIDRRHKGLDSVDACMAFLDSLSLDPKTDRRLSKLKEMFQEILYNNPPSKVSMKKARFYHSKIKPFLRKIAPKGCYYGRHPNDGNLFGYWRRSLLL